MLNLVLELDRFFKSRFGKQSLSKLLDRFTPKEKELLELLQQASFDRKNDDVLAYIDAHGESSFEKGIQRLHSKYATIFSEQMMRSSDQSFDVDRSRAVDCVRMTTMLSSTNCVMNINHYVRQGVQYAQRSWQTEFELRLLYGKLNTLGNIKQDAVGFQKTLRRVRELEEIHRAETNFQIQYWETYSMTRTRLSQIDVSESRIQQMWENIEKDISMRSNMYIYHHLCLLFEIKKDYGRMLHTANLALQYLNEMKVKSKKVLEPFLRRRYLSSLQLKKYEDIKSTIHTYFTYIPKYGLNWYVLSAYTAILYIHTKESAKALEFIRHTPKHNLGISPNVIQFYKLIQGYAKLLNNIEEKEAKNFRIFKLLNELPEHSRDKQGINIAILNLQILFFIWKRRYNDIIERVDALNQYAYRYLRKGKQFRSNCFIKMIVQMTKADFHPIRTARYTSELQAKLKSYPLELAEQPFDVEIIPYEDFWELIMKLLEKNSGIARDKYDL